MVLLHKVVAQRTRARAQWNICRAQRKNERFSRDTLLRGEIQAPFRKFRKFVWLAAAGSASIGTGTAVLQLLAKLAGAPRPPEVEISVRNIAINSVALAVLILLWRREDRLDERQLNRISREESLGELTLMLASGKQLQMKELRNYSRVCVFAGPADEIHESLKAARDCRDGLEEKNVLLVPIPTDGGRVQPPDANLDQRFVARPALVDRWINWINSQLQSVGMEENTPVHMLLTYEGRVVASGPGRPPWRALANE